MFASQLQSRLLAFGFPTPHPDTHTHTHPHTHTPAHPHTHTHTHTPTHPHTRTPTHPHPHTHTPTHPHTHTHTPTPTHTHTHTHAANLQSKTRRASGTPFCLRFLIPYQCDTRRETLGTESRTRQCTRQRLQRVGNPHVLPQPNTKSQTERCWGSTKPVDDGSGAEKDRRRTKDYFGRPDSRLPI